MKCGYCHKDMIIAGSTEPYSEGSAVFYDRDFMCVNSKCDNYAGLKTQEKVPLNTAAREVMERES